MRMRYDKEGDVLDLVVNDEQIHHAEEYDHIIVNFDEKNRIVEIEILNASEFIGGLFVGALMAEPKEKMIDVHGEIMKVLVTGCAGFLGSHLCDLLLLKGHEVICIDNLITGNTQNIEHIESDRFTYLKHDITEPIYFDDKIDYIFHLASPASPIDYLDLPIQTLKVGALGTYNMLGLAKEHGARFLLASTSEVYGDPLVNPQPETYWGNVNPIGPRGVYDEAKRYAEAITMAYHRYHSMDTRIARIFNTYGPRMRAGDGRVVPNFINQALRSEDLTVYGDGSQTRSFCYVSDLVDGLFRLMMSDFSDPVNIGNQGEMTVLEFVRKVVEVTGSDSRIVFEDLPVDDPNVRRPDISRAKDVLGWGPVVGLEEGLGFTIEYFKGIS